MMEYKGYQATVEFDDEAEVFHGTVASLRDVITFEGTTVAELQAEFRNSVDGYLAFCIEQGREPDKPYSGKFLVRMEPDQHRKVALASAKLGMSLNSWVLRVLDECADSTLTARSARVSVIGRIPQGVHWQKVAVTSLNVASANTSSAVREPADLPVGLKVVRQGPDSSKATLALWSEKIYA